MKNYSPFELPTESIYKFILFLAIVLLVCSSLAFMLPPDSGDWLRGPLIDDAYYYLSIARHLAGGEGITYGGIPVNGFQPLYLLVSLAAGAIADWNTVGTPAAVTIINWFLYNIIGLLLIIHYRTLLT